MVEYQEEHMAYKKCFSSRHHLVMQADLENSVGIVSVSGVFKGHVRNIFLWIVALGSI